MGYDIAPTSGYGNNNGIITKITTRGVQSTFDSSGNLYEADNTFGDIYKFTPGGARSTFAAVSGPNTMVFDNAGNMFVSSATGTILEITPGGTESTFATVGGTPNGMLLVVPEPSIPGLIGMGALVFLAYGRCKKGASPKKIWFVVTQTRPGAQFRR